MKKITEYTQKEFIESYEKLNSFIKENFEKEDLFFSTSVLNAIKCCRLCDHFEKDADKLFSFLSKEFYLTAQIIVGDREYSLKE